MDDIVTRLRESNGMTTSRSDDGFLSIHPDTDLLRLAADEIERLRKQVEDCEGDFHALKQMFDRTREQLALAHSILASESMGWLAGGTSNHEASHWDHLMPFIRTYWNKYGSFFRPVTNG